MPETREEKRAEGKIRHHDKSMREAGYSRCVLHEILGDFCRCCWNIYHGGSLECAKKAYWTTNVYEYLHTTSCQIQPCRFTPSLELEASGYGNLLRWVIDQIELAALWEGSTTHLRLHYGFIASVRNFQRYLNLKHASDWPQTTSRKEWIPDELASWTWQFNDSCGAGIYL